MVLEDMIVRGLRATEKMTWLDAYVKPCVVGGCIIVLILVWMTLCVGLVR